MLLSTPKFTNKTGKKCIYEHFVIITVGNDMFWTTFHFIIDIGFFVVDFEKKILDNCRYERTI